MNSAPTTAKHRLGDYVARMALACLLIPALSGCAIVSMAWNAALPQVKPAVYKKLAGQSVTVIVWADPATRIDNPRIQFDVAQMVLAKLQKSQKEDKPDELKLSTFPVTAGSVARFQEEHPDSIDSMVDIAPRLGTARVIYVELRSFQTRSNLSNDLYRGDVTGAVTVIEVTNGKGISVPVAEKIRITYPRNSTEEGLPNVGDSAIYAGTLAGFSDEVAKLFVSHGDDPDAEYATN